jgi:hypothetical protein
MLWSSPEFGFSPRAGGARRRRNREGYKETRDRAAAVFPEPRSFAAGDRLHLREQTGAAR